MKILHIIYDDIKNPWCGGGGAVRASTINEIIADKNDITVITGNYPGAQNEIINNVRYIRAGIKKPYILSRISFTFIILFLLKKFSSDIVVNDCSFFAPCFADWYTKRPVINIIHHLMGRHVFKIYPITGIFPFLFEKIFLTISKKIIIPSIAVKNQIKKKFPEKQIINIPNGISEQLFDLIPEEKGFILFIGRIDIYMKGLDLLIDAFSKIKNRGIKLKIAGDGKNKDVRKLKEMVENYKLKEKVELLGRVLEEEKKELIRTCLFLVMPSRFEGWGITGVEANAAGKPVIGTKIDGLSESLVDNKTAILIDSENSDKLIKTLQQLINNQEFRVKLGRQGRQWARRFSWPVIATEQYTFYRQTIRNKNNLKLQAKKVKHHNDLD